MTHPSVSHPHSARPVGGTSSDATPSETQPDVPWPKTGMFAGLGDTQDPPTLASVTDFLEPYDEPKMSHLGSALHSVLDSQLVLRSLGEGGAPGIPVNPPPPLSPECDPHNILVEFKDVDDANRWGGHTAPPRAPDDPPQSAVSAVGRATSVMVVATPLITQLTSSANTAGTGFHLYPELSVSGLRLELCHWRQVFAADVILKRWNVDGGEVGAGEVTHGTESGKFTSAVKQGTEDWYRQSAGTKVLDHWSLETVRWVDVTVSLRQQVSPKRDKKFRTPEICKTFDIHWTNLPLGKSGSVTPPRRQRRGAGAAEFSKASGTLTMTITFMRGPSCAV